MVLGQKGRKLFRGPGQEAQKKKLAGVTKTKNFGHVQDKSRISCLSHGDSGIKLGVTNIKTG